MTGRPAVLVRCPSNIITEKNVRKYSKKELRLHLENCATVLYLCLYKHEINKKIGTWPRDKPDSFTDL